MSENNPKPLTGLDLLRSPFPEHQISLKPVGIAKDAKKGQCKECGGYHGLPSQHLSYVGHAALTNRLLDCDPNWSWEPLALVDGLPSFDKSGGLWIKLTVCGVTRMGYGHAAVGTKEIGSREKEVIGDALRNAAMRFGAALDLWHKGELHKADPEPEPEAELFDDADAESEGLYVDKQALASLYTKFAGIQVSKAMILAFLKVTDDSKISWDDFERLYHIGSSIKNNKASVDEFFGVKK